MQAYIKLILTTPDGRRGETKIKGPAVNEAMIQAARELEYTVMTGVRYVPAKPKKKAKAKAKR